MERLFSPLKKFVEPSFSLPSPSFAAARFCSPDLISICGKMRAPTASRFWSQKKPCVLRWECLFHPVTGFRHATAAAVWGVLLAGFEAALASSGNVAASQASAFHSPLGRRQPAHWLWCFLMLVMICLMYFFQAPITAQRHCKSKYCRERRWDVL